ncbi:MAG: hypothetical protein M3308_04145, partial [Actinomycetota bacterium]|nr:hypothetical protein [Actinomycetota bacterium]
MRKRQRSPPGPALNELRYLRSGWLAWGVPAQGRGSRAACVDFANLERRIDGNDTRPWNKTLSP